MIRLTRSEIIFTAAKSSKSLALDLQLPPARTVHQQQRQPQQQQQQPQQQQQQQQQQQ